MFNPVFRRLGAGLVLLIVGLGAWAFFFEPGSLRVVDHDLPLQQASPPLAGLRIAVISDLHAGAPFIDESKIRRVVALTNASHPDLILIAGDTFEQNDWGGTPMPPRIVADALAGLQAPLGVFAVLGNHDIEDPPLYREQLRRIGITPIDNEVRRIAVGDLHFWLAGFGDLEKGFPKVAETLAQVDDSSPVLALTHDPDLFPTVPSRVNLLIAGHTHGGQVRLGILSYLILHESEHGDLRYPRGHYREQTDLFVSTGIGTSNLPVRFRVPPEISLLTLRQDHSPQDKSR